MLRNLLRLVEQLQATAPPMLGRWELVPHGGGFYALRIRYEGELISAPVEVVARPRRMGWLLADMIDG